MKFSIATIIAYAAILAVAQDGGPPPDDGAGGPPDGGPGGADGHHGFHGSPPPWLLKKDITCPAAGGTATFSHACPTGPPPTAMSHHPHSRPTGEPSKQHKWDGTVTVFPSGAPEVTMTRGIDCQGESGPSCAFITFASHTKCTPPTDLPKPSGPHKSWSHKSFPTMTASAGETKTVHAHGPPTCKAAETSIAVS